jgi:hypothetical protein
MGANSVHPALVPNLTLDLVLEQLLEGGMALEFRDLKEGASEVLESQECGPETGNPSGSAKSHNTARHSNTLDLGEGKTINNNVYLKYMLKSLYTPNLTDCLKRVAALNKYNSESTILDQDDDSEEPTLIPKDLIAVLVIADERPFTGIGKIHGLKVAIQSVNLIPHSMLHDLNIHVQYQMMQLVPRKNWLVLISTINVVVIGSGIATTKSFVSSPLPFLKPVGCTSCRLP